MIVQSSSSLLRRASLLRARRILRSILLLRPSFWTALIAVLAYWDRETALCGSFVYDDAGSIKNNVVVNNSVPWTQVFYRDYWGTKMTNVQSHKSFRPITTLTFKLNWLLAEHFQKQKLQKQQQQQQQPGEEGENSKSNKNALALDDSDFTVGFHIVNYLLHGLVTLLVTEVAGCVFYFSLDTDHPVLPEDDVALLQLLTGFFFGLHPVHVEAVSNLTSRGELIMSLFALLAFLSYASQLKQQQQQQQQLAHVSSIQQQQQQRQPPQQPQSWYSFSKLYIIPFLCMLLSLFSKEQGATTLISLVVYDFIIHYSSVREYINSIQAASSSSSSSSSSATAVSSAAAAATAPPLRAEEHQATTATDATTKSSSLTTCRSSSSSSSSNSPKGWASFLQRSTILAMQTVAACACRYWLNGETSPDFIYNQNPAGFSSDFYTRIVNITYVWCLYVWDAIYPGSLCPDWSGQSITLITRPFWNDDRLWYVVALWLAIAASVVSLLVGGLPTYTRTVSTTTFSANNNDKNNNNNALASTTDQRLLQSASSTSPPLHIPQPQTPQQLDLVAATRRVVLVSFFSFTAAPFFLSSNLIVVIGLMKADRVIYLPLLGYCLLQAWLHYIVFFFYHPAQHNSNCKPPPQQQESQQQQQQSGRDDAPTPTSSKRRPHHNNYYSYRFNFNNSNNNKVRYTLGHLLLFIQLVWYCRKVHERNIAWSHSLNLWMSAYQVNPRSYHSKCSMCVCVCVYMLFILSVLRLAWHRREVWCWCWSYFMSHYVLVVHARMFLQTLSLSQHVFLLRLSRVYGRQQSTIAAMSFH
jgi:Domain of unknown function (DUF1736)